MIIDCIADLHGNYPKLDGGDLLIVAGDLTAHNEGMEYIDFLEWLVLETKYRKKIFIAGNHDVLIEKHGIKIPAGYGEEYETEYLCDSGTEFEGLKIWGSPWTPWFHGVHPQCKAFMKSDSQLSKHWEKIPLDTDILITHGPPFGMLDKTTHGIYAGSKLLADRLLKLKLKLHIFGHIHEAYGQCHQAYETYANCPDEIFDEQNTSPIGHLSINCSYVNERYEPVNKPIRIEI